jgi:uncharacterized integral membrane protein
MSAQVPPPQQDGRQTSPERRTSKELARNVVAGVLGVYIVVFAVLNLDDVQVDWVFGSGRAPLIIVIVISLLVGIVLTYFAQRRTRKRP